MIVVVVVEQELCCVVELRPRWAVVVMSERSVNVTTLFLGRIR